MAGVEVPGAPGLLRLGFGCGSIGGELDHAASRRLLDAAYEAGFRHFDVAPSYGHGRAEAIVGEAFASVRDTVTIVTKAGITHPKATGGLRAARTIFLPLKAAFPGLWKAAAGRANRATAARGRFAREDVMNSVAESLRRLRMDRVDALLMHELLPEQVNDELLDTLQSLRLQGCAAAIGTGTSVEASLEISKHHSADFTWLQMNHYWGAFLPQIDRAGRPLVTHRSLRTGQRVIRTTECQELLAKGASLEALRRALDEPQRGPMLLLAAALLQNPRGRVLVSTRRAERLTGFVTLARNPTRDPLVPQLTDLLVRLSSTLTVADE